MRDGEDSKSGSTNLKSEVRQMRIARQRFEYVVLNFQSTKQLLQIDSYNCQKYTQLNFDLIKSNVNYTEEAANKLNRITEDYMQPRWRIHKKLSPWSLASDGKAFFTIKVLTIDANQIKKQLLAVFQDENNLVRVGRYIAEEEKNNLEWRDGRYRRKTRKKEKRSLNKVK